MADFADLEQRIDALCAATRVRADASLISAMEDTLSEGYARALAAESEIRGLDRRLAALMETLDPVDASEMRALASERRRVAGRVSRLRERLAAMRDGFVVTSQG